MKGARDLRRHSSPLGLSLRRFGHNRLATASAAGILALGLIGFMSLPFSLAWYDHQVLELARSAPTLSHPAAYPDTAASLLERTSLGRFLSPLGPTVFRFGGLMGFDRLGRSILYRSLLGGLISLAIGVCAAFLSVSLGVAWGAAAGLAGGKVDMVLMRVVDVLYALPYILLVVLFKVALDAPLVNLLDSSRLANIIVLFIAIGANSWLTMARVVRGQVLTLRERPFIQAARTYGAGRLRILLWHVLPNLIGPIVVYGSLIVPQAILSESFLSFLGIGVGRPVPTWGLLAAEGLHAVNSVANNWWMLVYPCGLLSATLLAFNFIGDGLRDAFDPKTTS